MVFLERLATSMMVATVGATIEVISTKSLIKHCNTTTKALIRTDNDDCYNQLMALQVKISHELKKRGVMNEQIVKNETNSGKKFIK
jgi:flagellar motor component MotA